LGGDLGRWDVSGNRAADGDLGGTSARVCGGFGLGAIGWTDRAFRSHFGLNGLADDFDVFAAVGADRA
jgi:hypothetical protein